MHRELPDYVERMLQAPNAEETHSLVRRCNISDKKWNVFRCVFGGALKRRKQKDIAADFGISAARVSIIVKDVLKRLTRVVEKPDAPDVVRAYRISRLEALKKINVVNAGKVRELTNLFEAECYHKCHPETNLGWDCKVDFVANGEKLSIIGRSRLTVPCGYLEPLKYTIFWSAKSPVPSAVPAEELFGRYDNIVGPDYHAVRNSRLLIDFDKDFWVVDRYMTFDKQERLVVFVEPAVIASVATAH